MAIIDLTPPAFLTDDPKKKKKQKGNQKGFVIDLSALENIPKPLKAPKSLNTTGEEAPKAKMVIAEDRPQTDTPMTDFLETFVPPPPKEQDMGMIKPDVYKAPSFNAEDIERANQIESDGRLGTMQSLQNVMNPVAVLQQLDPKTIKQKTSNLKDYAENFKLLLTGKPESVIQWAATNPIMTSMVDKWEDANNANTLAKQTYDPQLRTLADAKQISALANTLFTPISLAFDVLGNIPVVGEPIVDVVMRNFNTASAITQLITPTLNIFDNDNYNKEFQGILNEVIPIVALGFEGFAKKKGLSKKITPENINEVQAEYKVVAEKLAEDIRLDYDKYRKDPASTSAEFINKQLQLTQGEPYTKADWSVDVDGRITKGKQKPETLDIKEYKEPPKMLPESDVKPEQPPKQLTQGEVFTPADYIVDADGRVIKPKSETSKPVIYNPFDKSVQMPEQLPKDLTYNKADFVTDESGVTRQGKPAFEPIDIKSYNKPKGLLPEITDLTTDITTHQEVKANLDRASKDIANVLAIEKSDDLKYIYNKFKDGELDKILNGEKEPPITHGIIKRLESNGLLEPEWLDLAVKDNNYNITDKGKEVIKKIEQRLFDLKAVKRGESLMPEQMGIPEIKLTKKEQIRYSEYQKAKQSFKEKTQGRTNMTFGLDAIPEVITIGKYHISKGLKKFADWSKQMLRELGRVVKPHLRTIWEKVNKGIEKTAEFLFDVKPGDTSGTLGTLGGVTGKGKTPKGKRPIEVVIPSGDKKQKSKFGLLDRFINNTLDRKQTIKVITDKAKEKDLNKRADVGADILNTIHTVIGNNIMGNDGLMDIMQKDGNYKTYKGNIKTLEKIVGNNENALEFGQYLAARKILADRREVTELSKTRDQILQQPQTPESKTLVSSLDKRINQLTDILETNNFDEVQAKDIVTKSKEKFTGATRLYDDINQRLVELAENTQLISKEKAQMYRSNKDYASFQRDMSEVFGDGGDTSYISKNPASRLTATKERTGSEELDIVYPVYSQKNAIIETTSKGMRNLYLNKLWDSVQKDENLKDFMREISPENEMKSPNTISFRVKGERKVFEVVPELKASIEALNPKALEMYQKVLSEMSNTFRRGTTVANPFFALGNTQVDAITSMAQTKTGLNPVKTAANLVKLIMNDKETAESWNRYKRLGGETQTFTKSFETDPGTFRRNMLGDKTKADKIFNVVDSGMSVLEIPSNFTEMITRFGEFHAAKKKGYSDTVALSMAGQVSIPFHQRGVKMRGLSLALPYFNASLQALYKFSKSTKEKPGRVGLVTTAVVISGLAATIAGFEMATEEQKRKLAQMPIDLLARGYYIPMPDGKSLFRVRIPEQIGAVTSAIQLAIYKGLGYRDTKLKDYFAALSNVIPSRLDATSPGEMVMGMLPKPLDVAVSLVTNTKTFPKLAPIVPDWLKQYDEGQQYLEYTTEISKSVGKYLGIPPVMLDYAISNTVGGFPMFLYEAAGNFLSGENEQTGNKALSKLGLAGQNDAYIMAGNIYDNFYETKEELDKSYLTSKNITKENMGKEQYNMYKAYTQLNEELSDLHTYHRTFKELPPKAQDVVWNTLIHLEDKPFEQLITDIEKLSQVNDELIRPKIKSRNKLFDKEDFKEDIEGKFEDYDAEIKGEEKSDNPFKQPKLEKSDNPFKRR